MLRYVHVFLSSMCLSIPTVMQADWLGEGVLLVHPCSIPIPSFEMSEPVGYIHLPPRILVHFKGNSSHGGSGSNNCLNQTYNCDAFQVLELAVHWGRGIHMCLYMQWPQITLSMWSWRLVLTAVILLQFTTGRREWSLLQYCNCGTEISLPTGMEPSKHSRRGAMAVLYGTSVLAHCCWILGLSLLWIWVARSDSILLVMMDLCDGLYWFLSVCLSLFHSQLAALCGPKYPNSILHL